MKKLFFIFCIQIIYTNSINAQHQPIAAMVQMYKGRPTIMLNGKPEYPAIYSLTDVPGGRWSWEELPAYNMKSFYNAGFKLIQVDLFFDHIWQKDGTINLDTAKMQLRGILKNCPGAAIFIRFHVNPPKWWQQKNKDQNTVYADTKPTPDYTWGLQRIIEDDKETPERFSLASSKWLNDASAKLKIFLLQLQNLPEANRIAGIQVASGVYGEWHYWGFINNEPDMSTPMLDYFRQWLKKKYISNTNLQQAWNNNSVTFANAQLPTLEERLNTKNGIFRDPVKEKKIIDYYQAQHACVADDILHFCRLIKQTWKRPIITGAFYGYFYSVFGRETAGGHLELQKVLQSPYIDFLSGPNTYYPDAVLCGQPYRSRSLINSVLLHKKLWLDEMDQQPPLLPLKDSGFKISLAKSIATVRRNMLFTFSKGMGLWFYDFGPSGFNGGNRLNDHGSWGWWDEPLLMKNIKETKKILERKTKSEFYSAADVLLVHDTRSFYYIGSDKKSSNMAHYINNWIPPAIFKSGVVHDVIDVNDLDKVNINQYKAIVFMNTWILSDEQRKNITAIAAKHNRHLIFLYASGYGNEKEFNKEFIESITGMRLKQNIVDSTLEIMVNDDLLPGYKYTFNFMANPLFTVDDKNATPLAKINKTEKVIIATKKLDSCFSWFIACPPDNPGIWRNIFKQAGANIYTDKEDIVYNGGGILSVHTLTGGDRKITLKNGKVISLQLPASSTTLLDSETGEVLLQ